MSYFVAETPTMCMKCSAASVDVRGVMRSPFLYEERDGLFGGCPEYVCLYCGAHHYVEAAPPLDVDRKNYKRERGGYHVRDGVKL